MNYFWLPDHVFEQRLSVHELAVYAYLCRCANAARVAWPKQATIGRVCRMKRATVGACLNRLRSRGMVTWRKGTRGASNRYQLHEPDAWNAARPVVPERGLLKD